MYIALLSQQNQATGILLEKNNRLNYDTFFLVFIFNATQVSTLIFDQFLFDVLY